MHPCTVINWGAISNVGYMARHADIGRYLGWSGLIGVSADEAVAALETTLRRDLASVLLIRAEIGMPPPT